MGLWEISYLCCIWVLFFFLVAKLISWSESKYLRRKRADNTRIELVAEVEKKRES